MGRQSGGVRLFKHRERFLFQHRRNAPAARLPSAVLLGTVLKFNFGIAVYSSFSRSAGFSSASRKMLLRTFGWRIFEA